MREINFFSTFASSRTTFIKTPEDAKRLKFAAVVVSSILVLHVGFGIYSLVNTIQINRINDFFDMQETKDTINELNKRDIEIDQLSKYNEIITRAEGLITRKNIINDKLITKINGIIPHPIELTSLNTTMDSVTITGLTPNTIHVAELEYNLNQLVFIQNVKVTEIKPNEKLGSGNFSFTIDCKLSGGVA